jgi:exopolysaccharide production protein ExoQ
MDGSTSVRTGLAAPNRRSLGIYRINIDWCLWCIALTSLEFGQYLQTISFYSFTASVLLYFLGRPELTLRAFYLGGVQWTIVVLYLLSALWSPIPDFSFRLALETALSFGAALVLARALSPYSLMTALMCALLMPTAASILDPKMQMNEGVMAMVGVFGSKNQFGLSQGLLFMVCIWIVRDKSRAILVRGLALVGCLSAMYLLVAARSVDSSAIGLGALGCGFMAFNLNRFPKRWRLPIFWGTTVFVLVWFVFLFVIADDLFGSILGAFGKNATLTGRTIIWERARDVWDQKPFLGTGLGGFWVWGNPYAEDLWARFQPGRTGINFHNLWYEMGVQFGYVGFVMTIMIVYLTNMQVIRWVIREPTLASCFFFSFLIFADIRSFLETELLGQFSLTSTLFIVSWSYARQANRQQAVDQRADLTGSTRFGAPHGRFAWRLPHRR